MSTRRQHNRLDKIEDTAGSDGGTHHVVTYAEGPAADWADFTDEDELTAWEDSLPAHDSVCVVVFEYSRSASKNR